jgi:tetratricopeptide (TPR) repeat protein
MEERRKENNRMKEMIKIASYSLFFYFLFSFAQSVAQNNVWRDSLATLNSEIKKNPGSTDLRLKKAAVNIELNQWEYAVEEYGNVLRLEPKSLAALYFRAYAYMHLRQYAQAKADYETFLSVAPVHMEARLGLATVNEKMGRLTDATDELNRLVEMFPDSAMVWAARASFETTRQQYDMALYDWGEAISREPLNVDYVASQTDVLLALGRRDEARKQLEAAIDRGIPRGVLREWIARCK